MPTESIVGIVIQARDEATPSAATEPMSAETLGAIRGLIRAELRRCGLRPPSPSGLGTWRWSDAEDAWIPVGRPDAPARPPARPSA